MHVHQFRQEDGCDPKPAVLLLIDRFRLWDKKMHILDGERRGMNAKLRERLSEGRGINRFRGERPRLAESDPTGRAELAGHANAVDGFRGMAGKPT